METKNLPVAVIGAGPVGLAAAARLVERGLRPALFEKGSRVGAAILEWGHVRVFSPWDYNVDAAARALLADQGISAPSGDYLPTGAEIVTQYLEPLSRVPAIAAGLHLGATVTGITRQGHDLMSNDGRADAPFVVRYRDASGEHRLLARAVIDASGTWSRPSPMGADGLAVPGEAETSDLIAYGIPDVDGAERDTYAGKRTLVLGSGHSAINVALALLDLQEKAPGTQVLWALRRDRIARLLGGGLNDQLPGRGSLGLAAKQAIDDGPARHACALRHRPRRPLRRRPQGRSDARRPRRPSRRSTASWSRQVSGRTSRSCANCALASIPPSRRRPRLRR